MTPSGIVFGNGESVARRDVPELPIAAFAELVRERVASGGRIAALFGTPSKDDSLRLTAILALGASGTLEAAETVVGSRYPALTPGCPAAQGFEREIAEQWGVVPEGHPWLKPVRFHRSYVAGRDAWGRRDSDEILPCVTDFYRVEGEEVHEVAVGPVHAGVIEPGHFRFQCHGETVFHLEISLGYQHRGAERALAAAPWARAPFLAETLAGDTSVGHAWAHALAVEALGGRPAPPRGEVLRGVALELERLANHTGDLGALSGDVAYLPTLSFCGRLRGDFLNQTALLCGNRFGRGLVRPGGVAFDLEPERAEELARRLESTVRDVGGAVDLLWTTPSVMGRFEETGTVDRETALSLGLVGPAARASGLERDARFEFPHGVYRLAHVPVAAWPTGDVFARAWVRWLEIGYSAAFVRERIAALPEGPVREPPAPPRPGRMAAALIEAWRGEVCHVVGTGPSGAVETYKVVDPSFHNWMGLSMALRNQAISDFPLCNKSFNLSYCGHDL